MRKSEPTAFANKNSDLTNTGQIFWEFFLKFFDFYPRLLARRAKVRYCGGFVGRFCAPWAAPISGAAANAARQASGIAVGLTIPLIFAPVSQPEPYTLVRKPVRYLRISMGHDLRVTVTAPPQVPQKDIDAFVASRAEWLMQTRRRVQARLERAASALPPVPPGMALLHWEAVTPPVSASDPDRLYAWYRNYAKQTLTPRVAELAALHGFSFQRVTIKDIRSKWGSCSSKQNINLNWRLIKAPVWVADYIILHELSHTVHMNHSAGFWALVAKVCPDYRRAEQWLKTYEQALFL